MSKNKYSATIIGLGKIAFLDSFSSMSPYCISHADAYERHNDVAINRGIDPDYKARSLFQEQFSVPVFSSIEECNNFDNTEIVSICSTYESHYDIVKSCQQLEVPMIWLEKPVVQSLKQYEELFLNDSSKILVSFPRRYLTYIKSLKNDLCIGVYGEVLAINVVYSKNLLHNAIHYIDLINFLLDVKNYQVLFTDNHRVGPSFSYVTDNSTIANFTFTDLPFHYFNMDILTSSHKISLGNGCASINIYDINDDEFFPNNKTLTCVLSSNKKEDFFNYMLNPLIDLINSYELNSSPSSNLESSFLAHKLVFELLGK